ncbi:MAG: hypothetical protein FJW40_00530 [Acidobacteria bacterium]|nr:hypothetical protein [Acidobacteriota bacterium]
MTVGLPLTAPSLRGAEEAAPRDSPEKVHDAAGQFEALMVEQLLKMMRTEGEGWLGGSADSSGDILQGMAEQAFAKVIGERGGFGLATMIEKQMSERPATGATALK